MTQRRGAIGRPKKALESGYFLVEARLKSAPAPRGRRPAPRTRRGSRRRAPQTRRGGGADRQGPSPSVVSAGLDLLRHLAAEDPVGVAGVEEGQRHHDREADKREELRVHRVRRLPDGDVRRHDIGKEADREAGIAEKEEGDGEEERAVLSPILDPAVKPPGRQGREERYRREVG